ncbi:MAG TPA: hypothetical protein VN372_04650 [Methanospirillum sp.]|nr:hypothetical protein [Methanospirillum sp.]
MIVELIAGFCGGTAVINGIGLYLVYRQYRVLASTSMEFAAQVIASIKEDQDGTLMVDTLDLAGISMDHISQLSGLIRWIKE